MCAPASYASAGVHLRARGLEITGPTWSRTTNADEEQDDLDDHSGTENRKRAVQHRRVSVGMPSALRTAVASSLQATSIPRAATASSGPPDGCRRVTAVAPRPTLQSHSAAHLQQPWHPVRV